MRAHEPSLVSASGDLSQSPPPHRFSFTQCPMPFVTLPPRMSVGEKGMVVNMHESGMSPNGNIPEHRPRLVQHLPHHPRRHVWARGRLAGTTGGWPGGRPCSWSSGPAASCKAGWPAGGSSIVLYAKYMQTYLQTYANCIQTYMQTYMQTSGRNYEIHI